MIDFDATGNPADVVSVAGLMQDTRYTVQNVSTIATLFLREQAARPSLSTRAFRIESGGIFTLRPDGTPIWLWTDNGTCPVILSEAA